MKKKLKILKLIYDVSLSMTLCSFTAILVFAGGDNLSTAIIYSAIIMVISGLSFIITGNHIRYNENKWKRGIK